MLISLTYNEGKSVIADTFMRTLKMQKKITANDNNFYLACLNEIVDEYNNTYHFPIGEKF